MSVESIILCPHPDDELHINFMSLCKQTENVILAIFTTGKAGLDDNSNISGADLVATRYRETLMAMHEIGIKPEQILFLGYSDGRENEDMTIKFKEQRIKQFILSIEYLDTLYNPKQIYAPLPLRYI
ncbi:MAG: PIG-L family deacetylase [Saprospiraceae bacterium]|nr:PIG-L family deacetylase [Saprospiraceae bacterium]